MLPGFYQAFEKLDQNLQERMRAYRNPAMVVALTDRDTLIRASAYGFANLEAQTPVDLSHLFAIGSIGKCFTGIAALQASEAGLLDLHAPVSEYLPWFRVKSNYSPITSHHLLTHSAGLAAGTDFSPDPRAEAWALRELEAGFEPGTHFFYSDVGYKVMGLVLEAVSGKSYSELIQTQILDPLEMRNTYAYMTHALRQRMPVGYRHLYDDRPNHASHPLVPADWLETNSGDGCIVSTAEDMARFARMLLNNGCTAEGKRILSDKSVQKLLTPMIEEDGESYSYGLHLFDDDGFRHAGHGGDIPGYESYLWLDLDNGLGTVVMMTQPYTPRASFLALEFFRAAYLGENLPDSPLPDFTHISSANELAGRYTRLAGEGSPYLHLEAEGSHLYLYCAGQDGFERVALEERGTDSFYVNHPDFDRYLLQFERDAAGNVVEVFYGPNWYVNDHYQGPRDFPTPPEWETFSGHYRAHNPWQTNFRVFPRKGRLILALPNGNEEVLVPLGANLFRIGEEDFIPERLEFDQIADGKALRATRSGCPYYRFFTP